MLYIHGRADSANVDGGIALSAYSSSSSSVAVSVGARSSTSAGTGTVGGSQAVAEALGNRQGAAVGGIRRVQDQLLGLPHR